MAAASGEGLARTPLLPAGTALALLGVLVYLGALCAACRRKGRKKKVPLDAVKLVDESLLRQTQLRSLSKSDTKLHELYRVKARDDTQRPASLDFPCAVAPPTGADSLHSSGVSVLLHRELPQIPVPELPAASPAPDQTYSNLLFTPLRKPVPDTVYECLAVGGRMPQCPPHPPVPRAWTAQGHGPDPDYEAVDMNWKKAAKRDKPGKPCAPENLYESVSDIWAGESRRASARTAANGLEVYITNL
ncbi:lck-interacting transmembrane adapter 1 [Grus japonensis]|uniref:Lck-interacting transmembrane adapter 1 n=1 Tax=Grus japonensis TaxID=30415 RepID=A0ABC9XI81_GRUJA